MKKSISTLLAIFFFASQSDAQTWNEIPSGTNKTLNSVSFPSASVGYIVGNDSLILKTVDGGLTWNPLDLANFNFAGTTNNFLSVQFLTDDIGYVTVGPYYGLYKTIDGGVNWTIENTIYACFNHGLYFFDENNGFLGGSGCFSGDIINKLANGTWEETNITPQFIQGYGMINNFDFWDDSLGLGTSGGGGAYFFRTTNGGTTWDTIPNTLTVNDEMTSVLFIDSSRVLATYLHGQNGGFGVLLSMDGGLTWQDHMNSATFFYPSMHATHKSGNGHVYIGGQVQIPTNGVYSGMIYGSDDQITFWTYENVARSIRDFDSYSDSVVFAVGENGYIIVNQPLAGLSLDDNLIDDLLLVFPNPSNGEIHITNNQSNLDEIQLFDVRGSEISYATISQKTNNEWSINNLKSGVYLLKIRSDNYWSSKKVVIF